MRIGFWASFALMLVALPGLVSAGGAGEVVLELRSLTQTAWVNTPLPLELSLHGRSVDRLLASTPGLQTPADSTLFEPRKPHRFAMRFEVLPDKIGELVLGPYELSFGGRKVRSKRLVLQVLKMPDVPSTVQLSVEPAVIDLGGRFQLKLTANNRRAHQATLKASKRYAITKQSTSMSYRFVSGRKTEQHVRSFEIQALQPGKLLLGRSDLENLAKDIKVEGLTVEVR